MRLRAPERREVGGRGLSRPVAAPGPLAVPWRCGGGLRGGRTARTGVRAPAETARQVSGEVLPPRCPGAGAAGDAAVTPSSCAGCHGVGVRGTEEPGLAGETTASSAGRPPWKS